jgi:hypothetical protein
VTLIPIEEFLYLNKEKSLRTKIIVTKYTIRQISGSKKNKSSRDKRSVEVEMRAGKV